MNNYDEYCERIRDAARESSAAIAEGRAMLMIERDPMLRRKIMAQLTADTAEFQRIVRDVLNLAKVEAWKDSVRN